MPRAAEVHRGAIPEHLADPAGPRCTAVANTEAGTPKQMEFWRCAYRPGHPGPHYRGGMIW